MKKEKFSLSVVTIATPCNMKWEQMYGDDKVRYCNDCKLNVYNLSGMTKTEAESLIEKKEGNLCIRYYRRADGTILTQDCPVGLAKLKKRARQVATAAISLTISLFSGIFFYWKDSNIFEFIANHKINKIQKIASSELSDTNKSKNAQQSTPKKYIDETDFADYREPRKDPFYTERFITGKFTTPRDSDEEKTDKKCLIAE